MGQKDGNLHPSSLAPLSQLVDQHPHQLVGQTVGQVGQRGTVGPKSAYVCDICSTDNIFGLIFTPHKTDIASKQHKSQQNIIQCKCVMWSKMCHVEQVIDDFDHGHGNGNDGNDEGMMMMTMTICIK